MRLNPKTFLFGKNEEKKPPVLLAVTPPRTGERTLLGVENLLQSIAVPEPFSLELAGDMDGVSLMARCIDDRVVRGQLAAHYPQAHIRAVPGESDPMNLSEGEQAWGVSLRADSPEYVPLRTFQDDDLLDPGSDPLIALMGSLSALYEGERVVARLLLNSLGPDWSQHHNKRIIPRSDSPVADPSSSNRGTGPQMNGIALAFLGGGALVLIQGYQWVQSGEIWKAAALGAGVSLGLAAAGWAWQRWRRSQDRIEDPVQIREKVSRIAFDGEIQIVAVFPANTGSQRAREILDPIIAAYRHYDNPAGARFKVGKIRPVVTDPFMLQPQSSGIFGRRSILGVREVACLWHPPGRLGTRLLWWSVPGPGRWFPPLGA